MITYNDLLKRINAVPIKKVRDAMLDLATVIGGDDFANGQDAPTASLAAATYSYDESGNASGLRGPFGPGVTGEFLVVSASAPDNDDGRADGTIWIQTAAGA